MGWLNRLLTDVFIVTVLFSVSVGTFLGYINRKGEERARGWMYLSLFFFFLGLYVFFDNLLAIYFSGGRNTLHWRIPVVIITNYGIFIFSVLTLIVELRMNKKQKMPLMIAAGLLSYVPAVSILTVKLGGDWYQKNLDAPVLAAFIVMDVAVTIYCGIILARKKLYKDFRSLITYTGVSLTGFFLCIMKYILQENPQRYQSHTYLALALFLPIFVFLLSRQSFTEYKELLELRKAQELFNSGSLRKIDIDRNSITFSVTDKEWIIIRKLCDGLLYKEIALEMNISLSSVKKSVHSIYGKAEVQNRVELIKQMVGIQ